MAMLKSTKLFGCILLLFGISYTLQAQDRILPGTDGAALVQSVNVPTNLYTGTASVQIPMCTLETLGGPAINVGLSYQASGIKVEDRETNVGLGWQLTGGGMVTRVVRGRPDELGYRATSGQKHGTLIPTSEVLTTSQFNSYSDENFKFDGEPDVYYFQTPTCSGTFVVDYNGEVCLMPYQDIIVDFPPAPNRYIYITDTSGIKYLFGSTSDTRETREYKKSDETTWTSYISSWLLETMAVNNKTIAQYYYIPRGGGVVSYTTSNTITTYESNESQQTPQGIFYEATATTDIIQEFREPDAKYLSAITTTNGRSVTFEYSGGNLLRMRAQEGEGTTYNYYTYRFSYQGISDGRKVLKKIDMGNSTNSLTKPVAEFEYHDLNVSPTNYKKCFDAYGYYNGSSLARTRHVDARLTYMIYDSRDRTCNIQYAIHGALHRIRYSTGGYKDFEYESHRSGGSSSPKGGLRIKSISEYESYGTLANKTTYHYEGAEVGGSSGNSFAAPPRYARVKQFKERIYPFPTPVTEYDVSEKPINNFWDFDGTVVAYPKVKEVFSNGGYNIYTFYTYNDFSDSSGQKRECDQSSIGWMADNNDLVPATTRFWGRGMPKEEIQYTAEGEKISHTIHTYDLSLTQKRAVKAYVLFVYPDLIANNPKSNYPVKKYIGKYQWVSQPVRLKSVETLATDYSLQAKTTFTYSDTYPTLPKSTARTDADGEILTTTVKYPFDYAQTSFSSSDNQLKALHYMKEGHAINTPIEILTSNSSDGRIISGELNKFTMRGLNVVLDEKMGLRGQYPLLQGFTHARAGSSFSHSSLYKTDMKYYEYTDKLLPSIYRTGDGPIQAVIYGHSGLYPIAAFNNAYTEQDLQNGNRIVYWNKITSNTTCTVYWRGSEVQVSYLKLINGKWNKFRYILDTANIGPNSALPKVTIPATTSSPVRDLVIAPKYATYSSSTLMPGIGTTSETDMNGSTIYYDYEPWGRVSTIRDNDENVLTEYEYSF